MRMISDHQYPQFLKLCLTVVMLTLMDPVDFTRVTSRPSPEHRIFQWSLYSASVPPINPNIPDIVDCGSGLNICIFRLWLPLSDGKCTLPYPRTKDRPKKSVPQSATTSWGQPATQVVQKEASKGRFHVISLPLDAATWLVKFLSPLSMSQSTPCMMEQKAVRESSSWKMPVYMTPVKVTKSASLRIILGMRLRSSFTASSSSSSGWLTSSSRSVSTLRGFSFLGNLFFIIFD